MPLLIKFFYHRSFPFFFVCAFLWSSREIIESNLFFKRLTSEDYFTRSSRFQTAPTARHQPPAPVTVWLSWVVCVGASRTPVNNLGSCSWRLCARVSLANFLIRTVNYYFPPGLINGLVSSDFLLIFLMKILQALLIISMWKVFSLVPT